MGLPIRSREEELPLRLSPRAGLSHGPVSAPGPPGCAAGKEQRLAARDNLRVPDHEREAD